ncbi:MAG: 1-acyl-sn-glycerol-3-phosphate acyltransferase [Pseudonocardia sp.]|nr:1-acyl-sn-glycerol-3-phosphate acyltransferase [Pseudonocardia sp.]
MHDVARWIGTWLWIPVYRLQVHGRERVPATGPVVVVANHSAFIDGPLLFGLFRRRTVFWVKQEMFAGPLGWALPRLGQIPVRRGTADRTPLAAAVGVLRAGGLVAIFPEGTRGVGDVASVQQGAAWLARTTGALVVPVVCRGTRRPAGAGRRFRPRVDVLVGTPITLATGGGRPGLAAATETVRAELAATVHDLDRRRRSTP